MASVNDIRAMFPILSRKVYGKDLVYFDNAATAQRPQQVIDMSGTDLQHSPMPISIGASTGLPRKRQTNMRQLAMLYGTLSMLNAGRKLFSLPALRHR